MVQQVLSVLLLAGGLAYGAAILWNIYRGRTELCREKGRVPLLAALEAAIYFCASLGISDYLLNTLVFKHGNYADDKALPGTLVVCGLTPGGLIAFSLLRSEHPAEIETLIVCGLCVVGGSMAGAKLVGRLNGERVRTIMRFALVGSFVILVGRMILSAGEAGTAAGLSGIKLVIAAALCFVTAVINMFGIPMKPTWTALFLLLGLTPIATLSLVLVLGALSPMGGGVSVLRKNNYHKKMALCAVVFGSLGAIAGTHAAVSLSAPVLNSILIIVMLIAIVTMFRKK